MNGLVYSALKWCSCFFFYLTSQILNGPGATIFLQMEREQSHNLRKAFAKNQLRAHRRIFHIFAPTLAPVPELRRAKKIEPVRQKNLLLSYSTPLTPDFYPERMRPSPHRPRGRPRAGRPGGEKPRADLPSFLAADMSALPCLLPSDSSTDL